MRNRGINADDEIKHGDDGGSVGKIRKLLPELMNPMLAQDRRLRCADILLQADEIEVAY
jgi:hypothetical protein